MRRALTSDHKGATFKSMKRVSKNLILFAFAFFFASAILCASLAAPSHSLASVIPCSQGMEMNDCEHPSYLCGFVRYSNFSSQNALSSARSNESLKNTLGAAAGEACFDGPAYGGPFVGNEHTNIFDIRPHKVSIRLYNSVLNL